MIDFWCSCKKGKVLEDKHNHTTMEVTSTDAENCCTSCGFYAVASIGRPLRDKPKSDSIRTRDKNIRQCHERKDGRYERIFDETYILELGVIL